MNSPTISIITVCYNDELPLKRTIDSVEKHEYDLQHIVIDGGSSDGTVELLKSANINYKNINYLSEPDKGVYDAINKGIKLATSDYILVLNAGDTFASNDILEKFFNSSFFASQEYLVARVSYIYLSGYVKEDSKMFPSKNNLECSHQAFIYKKALHDSLGLYDLKYKSAADYNFFSKVFKKYGLIQNEKFPFTISIREKFGGDMSDSIKHTIEMIKIDYKYGLLKYTSLRRVKELMIKLIRLVVNK